MPTPAELVIAAQKSAEQLAKTEKQKALANSVRNSAKVAMDKQATENKLKTIKKQTRNRNIYIGGAMVVGALGGFLIAKGFKATLTATILATVGGSLVLGIPAILLTKKDSAKRREEAKLLLEQKNTVIDTPKGTLEQAIKTVEDITSVIPKTQAKNVAGSGVLTIEEQAKLIPAPLLPIVPAGSTNLNNFV